MMPVPEASSITQNLIKMILKKLEKQMEGKKPPFPQRPIFNCLLSNANPAQFLGKSQLGFSVHNMALRRKCSSNTAVFLCPGGPSRQLGARALTVL
jgi:hypothetical protein